MTLNKNSKYIIAYNESAIYAAECFAKVIKEFIKITHKKFSIKISHNEYLLLEQILLNPGITQGDLARKISIQRNYVSKLLSALENNGYITREQKTKPMLDWLCRLLGRKNIFMLMVTIFTMSSFLCGISTSMPLMVIGRFFQGFGGGILIPIAQAIVMENFKGKDLTTAITLFGLVVIVAPIIGPVLGGWITENYSWHWIFFMNVPIGMLIVAMTKTMIVDPPYAQKQKNVKTDWWGLIFLIMFAVAFEIMMDKANDEDWFNSVFICKLTVIWVIGLIGFIISQIKGKETLVRFNVLRNWNFTVGTLCITVMNAVLLGSLAMIPQFMQNMMGSMLTQAVYL